MEQKDLDDLAMISVGLDPSPNYNYTHGFEMARILEEGRSVVFFTDLKFQYDMDNEKGGDKSNFEINGKNLVARIANGRLFFNELNGETSSYTQLNYDLSEREFDKFPDHYDIEIHGAPHTVQIKCSPRESRPRLPDVFSPNYIKPEEVHSRFFEQYAKVFGLELAEGKEEPNRRSGFNDIPYFKQTFSLPTGQKFALSRYIEENNVIEPRILNLSFDTDEALDNLLQKRQLSGLHCEKQGNYRIMATNRRLANLILVTDMIKEYHSKHQ